jgi:uncharacterized membrane protein
MLFKHIIACTTCNKDLQQGILESTMMPNLLTIMSAFIITAAMVIILARISSNRYRKVMLMHPAELIPDPVPLATAATVLGIGLGGFADGIVLHQILQWHEMLSNKVGVDTLTGKSVNMFWDGIFHFFCLIIVITGVFLLHRIFVRKNVAVARRILIGGLFLGWGIFNIIEGLIDHQILKLHNVYEFSSQPELYNIGFLVISLIMAIVGWFAIHSYYSKARPAR